MIANDILNFELDHFKNGWGNTIDFSVINEANVRKALSKALNDALAMAVQRHKTTYKNIEGTVLDAFIEDYMQISTVRDEELSNDTFNVKFNTLTSRFVDKMNEVNRPMFATFGFAQKFVSMSFKYMYCFDNSIRENFVYCKLPLDKYTINWYRKYGNKRLINQFKNIKFSWANLEEDLYNNIQNDIDNVLANGCNYQIKCNDSSEIIVLPTEKIKVEFIVWSQERLYEIYNEILGFSDYFDRLGITIE